MGNLSNQLGTQKVLVSVEKDKMEQGLAELLSFDLDFTENEEYFREDTLSLGYENEAERLVREYTAENEVKTKKQVFECCDALLSKVFDSSYYGNWTLDVTESRNDGEYIVYVTYQY